MSYQRPGRPSNASGSDISSIQTNGKGSGDPRTRAEQFEEEKKRIIESCFTKKEEDGAFAESYITHIQIEEDSTCPSSPPPPDSAPSNKKPRVIIVSVRRSGRVRLHKARENSNKSFSIGKTWLLDHLSAIESFTSAVTATPEEAQRKAWAGDTGMLVTVQKPYFWRAKSAVEKDFFMSSLVRIYKKYTGGKEPALTGFTAQELAAFGIGTQPPPKTPQPTTSRPSLAPEPSPALRSASSEQLAAPVSRASADPLRPPSSGASSMRTTESQERIPPLPGQFPPDTPRSVKPPDSRQRYQTSADHGSASRPDALRPPSAPRENRVGRSFDANSSVESFSSSRQEAATPPVIPNQDRLRSNGTYSPLKKVETPPEPPVPGPRSPERAASSARRFGSSSSNNNESLPERRRPTISKEPVGLGVTNNDVPSPLEPRKTPVNGSSAEPPQEKAPPAAAPTDGTNEVSAKIQNLISPLSPPTEPDSPAIGEGFRPGLGPMIKKRSAKDIAGQFRKAAVAANAFKPRAGGAGDRLRNEAAKQTSGADGINGVFKAPTINKDDLRGSQPQTPDTSAQIDPLESASKSEDVVAATPKKVAETKAQTPSIEVPEPTPQPVAEAKEESKPVTEEKKKKRPSNHSAKYASVLGFDVYILEGRTADIELSLEDCNWIEDEKKKIITEDVQTEIRKDLAKAETGTWLSSFEQGDERIGAVSKMLDKALAECDELDGLLTLYDAELGTLNEDVSYIEAQSQGLQVQTANQRLLTTEQKSLLETISISPSQLRVLKESSLSEMEAIASVEAALSQLFKAMLTIDPKLRSHDRAGFADVLRDGVGASGSKISSEVSGMRAVQEKKDGYRSESVDFILRLKSQMSGLIQECETLTRQATDSSRTSASSKTKIDLRRRDKARSTLWVYSPLLLFAREIDPLEWGNMLSIYERNIKRSYQDEHRECIAAWRRIAKKPTGDEQDILFTNEEKENESFVGRKLTVKRSKTLREGPRVSTSDKVQEGKIPNYEAFANALYDTSQSIMEEQNFISDIFHVSSAETSDFPDLIVNVPPQDRHGRDLSTHRQFDPDRNMAKQLQNTMEEMFSFWSTEVQTIVDWAISYDPLQGVGLLCALESRYVELEDSNQEFVVNVLKQARDRLSIRFDRFVEEQIRGIEDTKVKINKRKGVIAFIKTFPYFSSAVENMLPSPQADALEVREMVNAVYRRIVKAMFESLKFIAKESPVVMAGHKAPGQTGGEAEDKEILNYHILLIENMNHYVEEVDARNNPVLEDTKREAVREMSEHMNLYLDAVIRRPLGKLLDSIESTESLVTMAENAGDSPASVAAKASHSRSIFKKILSAYDAKEVRHGIDALRKRVDKHFGNADDPGLSRNLVAKVLQECEERYQDALTRTTKIVREVYEGQLEIEFKKDDISNAFRR